MTRHRPHPVLASLLALSLLADTAMAALPTHDGLTLVMPVIDMAAFDYEYSGGAR